MWGLPGPERYDPCGLSIPGMDPMGRTEKPLAAVTSHGPRAILEVRQQLRASLLLLNQKVQRFPTLSRAGGAWPRMDGGRGAGLRLGTPALATSL